MSGILLILLGIWGIFIPFVGPYFDYAYTPADAWNYTDGRLLLEILPGAAAVIGGLFVVGSANRAIAMVGGLLAAAGGAWFVVGMPLSELWESPTVGSPIGGTTRQALEYLGFFGGLGVVVVFVSAFVLGRLAVIGVRDAELAAARAEPPPPTPYEEDTAPTAYEEGAAAAPAEEPTTTDEYEYDPRSDRSRHADAP